MEGDEHIHNTHDMYLNSHSGHRQVIKRIDCANFDHGKMANGFEWRTLLNLAISILNLSYPKRDHYSF